MSCQSWTALATSGFLAVLSVSLSLACRSGRLMSSGLSCQDKQLIVDMHNRLRSNVATGRVSGQPSAANMMEMVWDEELARSAQYWANQCTNSHDTGGARGVSRFPVGQNIASTWSSPRPNAYGAAPDFTTQITNWFNEVYSFRYGRSGSGFGHYSQVVWGDSHRIGCGFSYFYSGARYTKLYVCNYAPGGNVVGYPPYRSGQPACSSYGLSASRRYPGLCEVRGYNSYPCYALYG